MNAMYKRVSFFFFFFFFGGGELRILSLIKLVFDLL